jgi:hypothetical protein
MVSELASNVVVHGSSQAKQKDYTICTCICCFSAKHTEEVRAKNGWLKIRTIAAPHSAVRVRFSVMSTTHTPKWILIVLKPAVEQHSGHILVYGFYDIWCIQCNFPDAGL